MQYKDIFKGDDSGQDANTAKDALAKDDIYISQEYISPRPLAKRPFIEITKVRKEGVSDRNIYQSSLLSVLKSWTLTASLGGAQFCFTSILSYGRPHLESIGFSDEVSIAMLLLVPMCGLVCQPVIGSYSDRCGTRIGSRTPFLLGVSVLTTITSFMFSCAPQVAAFLVPGSNPEKLSGSAEVIAKFMAVIAIVGSGIAQDVNSACSRSLLVDKVPFSQQSLANAFAAISGALGSLASYAICSVDLPEIVGTKKFNQLHLVSLVTSIVSFVTILITVVVAKEDPTPKMPKAKWYDPLKEIIYTVKDLPSPIRTLCNIQFFGSLPWYPILFFSSTWVEQNTYNPNIAVIGEDGMEEKMSNARHATLPLVIFSLASLLSGLFVPMAVPMSPPNQSWKKGWKRVIYVPYKILSSISSSTPKAWACSHIFLFMTLCVAPIKMGFYSCLFMLALIGYCWGIVQWIPFAILSELLIKLKQDYPYMLRSTTNLTIQENEPIDRELVSKVGSDRMVAQFPRNISEVMIDSGAIFGVHNVYIVVPQLVSALISLGVTHYIDTNFATSTSITTGWCMLACSPGALVAAYLIMKKVPKLDAQYGLCGGEKPEKEAVVCAYPTNT